MVSPLIRTTPVAVLLWLAIAAAAWAQTPPDPNLAVATAAETLNHLTSQGVPRQTIQIGSFDAATNKLTWAVPLEYLPGIPPDKRSDEGGPAKPVPRPEINSFNLRYQFTIVNPPSHAGDLQVAVSVPNQQGQMIDQPATFDASHKTAYVDFHPYSVAVQIVKITNAGTVIAPQLWPKLHPQLGAFVVPYLLLTVIYQPPGAESQACYSTTSTAGTNLSWDFASSWGLVNTVDTGQMLSTIQQIASGVGGIAQMFGGGDVISTAADALKVVKQIESDTQTTTTITQTFGKSQSRGWSVSLGRQFCTGVNPGPGQYPAKGDVYVYLQNALFAYLVSNGNVQLAPIAYAALRNDTVADMQAANVPASIIARFQSLDAVINPPPQGGSRAVPANVGIVGRAAAGPRLVYTADLECTVDTQPGITISRQQISSDGTSQGRTSTIVTQDTGLIDSILGTGAQQTSVTYSSAVSNWQGQADAATVVAQCSNYPAPGIWMPTYFDTLLGTFVGYPGNSAAGPPVVAGMVQDMQGHPAARRQVTLSQAEKRYITYSDAAGRFSFRGLALAQGAATLQARGGGTLPISYRGSPLNLAVQINGAPVPPAGGSRLPINNACCEIIAVSNAAVTAKVSSSGQIFQFQASPQLLPSLKVGQAVYANFTTRQVSLDGRSPCCRITSLGNMPPRPVNGLRSPSPQP